MKSYKTIGLLVLTVLFCVQAEARRKSPSPVLATPYDEPSVTVDAEGCITFRYCGKARHVSVYGDFLYTDDDTTLYTDHSHNIPMHRESNGCFYATTKPVSPETYTYCFRVDGKRTPDPLNNDTSWERLHIWNVVTVGGSPETDIYLEPAHRGELIQTRWFSSEEQLYRRVNIYLPYHYLQSPSETYPTLYLIHGINGYEGSWKERGRIIQVVENLVAEGKIHPMIVVMPDCNVGPHKDHPNHHTIFNNIMHYARLQHDYRLDHSICELVQLIDTTYRTNGVRAIAGLSDGSRISANVAKLMPGWFSAVGMFSPVVHKSQLPGDTCLATEYHVYVGKTDLFVNNGKRFYRRLAKQRGDASHQHLTVRGSGHNWRNWRRFCADFIQRWQGKKE